ncbi:MAG: hypothetical protein P1P90_06485 [Patescibacteria group bacterium]|nr:hypothetical protein [Patescibacteria group bacterium]
MKNSTKLLSGSLALAALTIMATSAAYAYQGDPNTQGPNYSPERHDAMEQAFDDNDYNAWKEQMNGRGRVTEVVNADNFSRFAEAHALAESGDLEGSKAIRAELGLGLHDGSGQGRKGSGQGKGMGQGNRSGARDGSGARAGTADCVLSN